MAALMWRCVTVLPHRAASLTRLADGSRKPWRPHLCFLRAQLTDSRTQVGQLLFKIAPVADVCTYIHVVQVFKTRKDLEDPKMVAAVHRRIADL